MENTNTMPSIYSDIVDMEFTLPTFTVYFAKSEEGNLILKGKVAMCPETVKAFSKKLNESIEKYEKIFGKIREVTPEIEAKLKEEREKEEREKEENEKK